MLRNYLSIGSFFYLLTMYQQSASYSLQQTHAIPLLIEPHATGTNTCRELSVGQIGNSTTNNSFAELGQLCLFSDGSYTVTE